MDYGQWSESKWPDLLCFITRVSIYTWPRRWLRIAAETTWMPGGWQRWGGAVEPPPQRNRNAVTRPIRYSCTVSAAVHCGNLSGWCVSSRNTRPWWRGWIGMLPRCPPRTPRRKRSRWRCGRSTSSGRRATLCAPKTRPSSQREVIDPLPPPSAVKPLVGCRCVGSG